MHYFIYTMSSAYLALVLWRSLMLFCESTANFYYSFILSLSARLLLASYYFSFWICAICFVISVNVLSYSVNFALDSCNFRFSSLFSFLSRAVACSLYYKSVLDLLSSSAYVDKAFYSSTMSVLNWMLWASDYA